MCIVGVTAASDTNATRTRAMRMNFGDDVIRAAAAETEGRATATVHLPSELARIAAAAGAEVVSRGTRSVAIIETRNAPASGRTAAILRLDSPPDTSASSATLLGGTWMRLIALKPVRRHLRAALEVAAEALIDLATATIKIECTIVTMIGTTGRDRMVAGPSRAAAVLAIHVATVARVTSTPENAMMNVEPATATLTVTRRITPSGAALTTAAIMA